MVTKYGPFVAHLNDNIAEIHKCELIIRWEIPTTLQDFWTIEEKQITMSTFLLLENEQNPTWNQILKKTQPLFHSTTAAARSASFREAKILSPSLSARCVVQSSLRQLPISEPNWDCVFITHCLIMIVLAR